MAPLWRWSEDVKPRTGKDETLSVKIEDMEDSVGRKEFVPFNRFLKKKLREKHLLFFVPV